MRCIINELSLRDVFKSPSDFKDCLSELLDIRASISSARQNLWVSRRIGEQKIYLGKIFSDLVRDISDKDFRRRILSWIDKSGPFWDDERQYVYNDYFEYKGKDVTNSGLGEAARRTHLGIATSTFSIENNGRFAASPLVVQQGLKEDPLGEVDVQNIWKCDQLKEFISRSLPVPDKWRDFFDSLAERYPNLIFSANLIDDVNSKPFSTTVIDRAYVLLSVLNEMVRETGEDGAWTARGRKLYQDYFEGRKPWFSDESETNKHNFKDKLTFNDPKNPGVPLFCPWHGKINTRPKFRIHFEWKRPKGQKAIKVVYVGPKITLQ